MADDRFPIRTWPRGERPRERLLDRGVGDLRDAELLAVLLPNGSREANALDRGRALLARFGSLRAVVDAPVARLRAAPGVGLAAAATLRAAGELARRYAAAPPARGRALRSSQAVHRDFGPRLAALRKEEFHVILLDGKNRPMKDVRVSEGSLTASLVHPREVFLPAIEESAAAVIVVHNHPSGDPTPSAEDVAITRRLRQGGEILGIHVLDHVVIGSGGYVSFADEGL